MMIFMLILKIIGIVLCVIIGILAMILFVPVCYKVDADIGEMDYTVRARWLGWLIRFEFRWKEKAHAVLKILWFVIDLTDPEAVAVRKAKKEVKARKKQEKKQKKEMRKSRKEQRKKRKKEVQQVSEQEKRAKQREEFRRQQEAEELSDAIENAQDSKGKTAEAEPEMAGTDVNAEKHTSEVNEKNASEEPDILKSKSKAGNGAEEKKSVLNKLKSVQEKTGSAKEKINNGIAVFRFLREQELIPAVWTKLKTFLLHIRPRVLQGHLQFGLSDPANTGQVLGGIAMIPFLYQTELQIKPDFEADENYIKGQLYTRGHICCIHLVVLLIRLLLDKKLRGVIHMIRENK